MKSKLFTTVFILAALASFCSFDLEAKSRTRFGFGFSSGYRAAAPVYVVPQPVYVAQPVYVYNAHPSYYPVYIDTAPVVYSAPTYVYPQTSRSSGFSFSFGNFWR